MKRMLALLAVTICAACGPTQSPECAQMLECSEHYADISNTDDGDWSAYEADGSCWTTEDAADACTTSCVDLIEVRADILAGSNEDEGPCAAS